MIQVNIHEAKTKLSHLLELAANGEKVIVCKHNVPYAELKAIAKPKVRRRVGFAKDIIKITDDCFDPVSDDELKLWEDGHFTDPMRNL